MSRLRLACGVLSLVLSGPLMAADLSSASLIEKGALTYGVAGTFAPFEFQKDGKLSGFDIDMIGAPWQEARGRGQADEHGVQGTDRRAARRPRRSHQLGHVHQRAACRPGRLRSLSQDRDARGGAGGQSRQDHRSRQFPVRQDHRCYARRHSGELRAPGRQALPRQGARRHQRDDAPHGAGFGAHAAAGTCRRPVQFHSGRGRADGESAGRLRRGRRGVRGQHTDRHGGAQGRWRP